jgi:hypothetical protein
MLTMHGDEFWLNPVHSQEHGQNARLVIPLDKIAEVVHALQDLLEEA